MGAVAGLAGGAAGAFLGSFFGPLGTAIGWAIGSLVGNLLFPARGPDGPKLENLKLQVSSYGVFKPIVYGTIRIAGNVIDASDLKPHSHSSGGKGGGGGSTTTTYTADICVLLTGCEIVDVTRCWALGETVWPNGNDPCPFTIYYGTQTQLPDPTFEALHGVGEVPAYRGRAYVVFEDFDLERYGNSIPQFNFEVVTAAGSIPWRVSTWSPPPTSYYEVGGAAIVDGVLTIGTYTSTGGPITDSLSYIERTYDTDGNELSASTPVNCLAPYGDNRFSAIQCANDSRIAFGQAFQLGAGADASAWYVSGVLAGAQPVAPAIGSESLYSCLPGSLPVRRYAPDVFDDALYLIGATSAAVGVWVARYPCPNGTPLSGPDAFYEFTTAGGIYQVAVGNDDQVYVLGPAGPDCVLAVFDLDLNLVHQGGTGEVPVTTLSNLYAFTVFNGYICFGSNTSVEPSGSGCEVYKIESDYSFTFVGSIPIAHIATPFPTPMVSLGNGLVLAQDGIISLNPPAGDVTLASIVSDISTRCDLTAGQVDVTELTDLVDGFVINQQQAGRDSILPLQSAYYFDGVESSGVMKFVKRGKDPIVSIPDDDLAATTNPDEAAPLSVYKRVKEADLPATLNVKYINAANDYEVGQQGERRQVTSSEQTRTIELPISLSDGKARQVAKALIYSAWFEREPETIRTSRKYAYLEPTDVIEARGGAIRIMQKSDEASNVVQFDGVPSIANIWTSSPVAGSGSGFRPSHPPTSQATRLLLLDIPLVRDSDVPGFYAAMAGSVDDTWRGANLYQSIDGGVTWNVVATSNTASVMGTCSNALAAFNSNIFDEGSVLHVVIGNGGGTLSSATEIAVLAGTNSCLIGNEIASFKNAVLTAPGEYDLSGFLRGRRGTEAFTGAHVAGERFVMLPVTNVAMPNAQLYHTYSYRAVTFGRPLAGTSSQDFANTGNALKPYSPTDVGGGCDASGNVTINWKRRTRVGGAWVDYVDVPLSEASEGYIVQIWDASYTICARVISGLTTQTCTYTAAQQTTDFGAVQQHVYFTVGQVGAFTLGAQTRGVAPSTGGSDGLPLVPVQPYVNPPISPPPGSTNPVNIEIAWPSYYLTGNAPIVGETFVGHFTTGGSIPLTGAIVAAEYADSAHMRRAWIATDSGGTNVVPGTLSQGSTVSSPVAGLSASTSYYWLMQIVNPDGSLDGIPGSHVGTVISLANVT